MTRAALLMTISACCLFAAGFDEARAGDGGDGAADTSRQFGLIFDFQFAPNLSSLYSYRNGGYTVSLGIGVNISPKFLMTLVIYTGEQNIPGEPSKPASGNLDVGGAAIEASYFFTEACLVRPYVAAGYGLYTDLVKTGTGGGYSGGGPHAEVGAQLECSRYFSVRAGTQYAALFFHNPVGDAASSPLFRSFTAHLLGGVLRLSFYPSVSP